MARATKEITKQINERAIVQTVLQQYRLPINGCHGISHWARVYEIGQKLAGLWNFAHDCDDLPQIDLRVPALFALLHDACRLDEGSDRMHGPRAKEWVYNSDELAELGVSQLSTENRDRLYDAIEHHTSGGTSGDMAIQICWDSDRLDLPRVGILNVDDRFLSEFTGQNGAVIDWAKHRAVGRDVPNRVFRDWGIWMEHKQELA